MDKKEKKALKKAIMQKLANEATKEGLAKLPMRRNDLSDLFDQLDEALSEDCDHTLNKTKAFLDSRGIEHEKVIGWLLEHGGGCDCEVINNVEPFCMDLFNVKSGERLTRDDETT